MIYLKAMPTASSLKEREGFYRTTHQNLPDHYVYLHTCDREELYYEGSGRNAYLDDVDEDIVRHLFTVVSGLDSPLIGENQIQSQVKRAYLEAVDQKTTSKNLNLLFQTALRVGKKVRSQTEISRGAMSHSQATVEIILNEDINIKTANIAVIGVHRMNEKIIQYLKKQHAGRIFLTNRTFEKAQVLADDLGCMAFPFESLPQMLKKMDIIISATSAPHTVISKKDLAFHKRQYLFDLASPPDIAEEVKDNAHLILYSLKDIEASVNDNIKLRKEKILLAERIIEEEVSEYQKDINRRQMVS